jgi:hypothetical protein
MEFAAMFAKAVEVRGVRADQVADTGTLGNRLSFMKLQVSVTQVPVSSSLLFSYVLACGGDESRLRCRNAHPGERLAAARLRLSDGLPSRGVRPPGRKRLADEGI